jgi:hypothetical protein
VNCLPGNESVMTIATRLLAIAGAFQCGHP